MTTKLALRSLAVIAVASIIGFALPTPKKASAQDNEEAYRQLSLFGDVFERVRNEYVEEKTDKEIIEAAINGMLTALDPHSGYLPDDNFEAMQVQTRGRFGGLGIEVTMDKGFVKVVSPIDDTPASSAGIQPEDFIIAIDGETYVGSADFLNLSEIIETSEVQANSVNVTLSGLDASLVSAALSESYQGRSLKIYFGFLDNTGAIIDTPYIIFSGRMDVMTIEDAGATANIGVTAESRLIDLDRSRTRRYTSEDQKIDYPNDKGLEMVASLQDKQITWGG